MIELKEVQPFPSIHDTGLLGRTKPYLIPPSRCSSLGRNARSMLWEMERPSGSFSIQPQKCTLRAGAWSVIASTLMLTPCIRVTPNRDGPIGQVSEGRAFSALSNLTPS